MPFELELEALDPDPLDELDAGAEAPPLEEDEDWVDGFAAGLEELDELEPHAATPSAASTSRTDANRRGDVMNAFIVTPISLARDYSRLRPKTPAERILFPDASAPGSKQLAACRRGRNPPTRRRCQQRVELIPGGSVNRALSMTLPLIATSALLAACGSSSSSSSSGSGGAGAASGSSAPASSGSGGYAGVYGGSSSSSTSATATMVTAKHSKAGTILAAGPKHLTVYLFEADKGSASACTGACATAWPPVTASGMPRAGGLAVAADLGTITRPDGTKQVTYKGHPLYYFIKDKDSGDAYGQGVKAFGSNWYTLAPSGKKIDNS